MRIMLSVVRMMEGLVRMMWMQFACSACYTLSLLKPVTVTAVTACTA